MKKRFSILQQLRKKKMLPVFLIAFATCTNIATAEFNAQAPQDAMPRLVDYHIENTSYIDCGVSGCGCKSCKSCQLGRNVCCPTMEQVTEEVPCWNVTCEKVCVPSVRMPWEAGGSKLTLFSWLAPKKRACSCGACAECVGSSDCCNTCGPGMHCTPKCGPVRCVSVLAPDSFEITKCRCKWEIRRLPACCQTDCLHCGEMVATPETEPAGEASLPPPAPEF